MKKRGTRETNYPLAISVLKQGEGEESRKLREKERERIKNKTWEPGYPCVYPRLRNCSINFSWQLDFFPLLPTKLFSQIETDHARRASGNYGSSVHELGGNTGGPCVIVSSQLSFLSLPSQPAPSTIPRRFCHSVINGPLFFFYDGYFSVFFELDPSKRNESFKSIDCLSWWSSYRRQIGKF